MKVTAIVHAYNQRPELLDAAVLSVLEQTRPADEVLVIDDGSDAPIAKPPHGVRVIRTEHRGISHAVNTGAAKATGDLLACCPSDDEWLPHKLETQLALVSETGAEASFTAYAEGERWDDEPPATVELPGFARRQLERDGWVTNMRADNCVYGGTRIVSRRLWLAMGGFCPQLRWVCDWHFHARVAEEVGWAYVDEPLTMRRVLPTGMWADAQRNAAEYNAERATVARWLRGAA